jgi:hypothetical protein
VQRLAMTGVDEADAGNACRTYEAVCECGQPIDTTPHILRYNQSSIVDQVSDQQQLSIHIHHPCPTSAKSAFRTATQMTACCALACGTCVHFDSS